MSEIVIYSAMVWTGPGRSHWTESLFPLDPYAQCARVFEKRVQAPSWFVELVQLAQTGQCLDRVTVQGWARELGLFPLPR